MRWSRAGIDISDGSVRAGRWPRRLAAAGILVAALAAGLAGGMPAAAASAPEGHPAGEGAVQGPTFVQLPPIVLPVLQGDRVARQAGLVLALELEPGKTAADLEPHRRQLYDAFISDLYALYDQEGANQRVINAALIKQRLLKTSNRILGPGLVRHVLIQQAFERPRG